MRPARIAIVGTGNIARIHLAALRSLAAEPEVVGCADIDSGRLADFCAEHGVQQRFGDLTALLRETRPDLVHLCTPPALHHQQAVSCLRAGVSVLAEKPPVLSLRQLDELAGLTGRRTGGGGGQGAAAGPWFATVFQHRFGSGARRLRALVSAGLLGRPLLAICHTAWFRDQAYFDVPWRGRWDSEGGGPTMGHGIHQLDLLVSVLGDWAQVSATARQQARRMETGDLSLAHVTFTSGAVASVVNSVLSPREESYLRFDFERGTVELTHLYGYGDGDWRITPAPGCEDVTAAWQAGEAGREHDGDADRQRQPHPGTVGRPGRPAGPAARVRVRARRCAAGVPAALLPSGPHPARPPGEPVPAA